MSQLPKRYTLGHKIGEGAMGEVYQAFDTQTERDVAIKVLPANSLQGPRRARFQREARTIARLEHPFVVPLYDFSLPKNPDEQPFLVMRYMTGGTLADKIRRGPLSKDEVIQITQRIGQALDAAHKRNLIHRDIKPGNILLDDDGYAYLADFGIVKDSEAKESLTNDGQPGTAPYMSPEQIRGEELDGRSDTYALGVVVFEMLTGTLPYGGNNLAMIFQGHLNERIPSVFSRVSDLPDEVDEILQKAMAKKPVDRFRKAEHLAHLLEAALQSPTAYMTSRDALIRTQEETFDTVTGTDANLDDQPGSNWALSDTKRTPEMPDTVDAQMQRRWQWLAGGLGVALLVVLALFIGSRLEPPASTTPDESLAVAIATEQAEETHTPRPPTPIADVILVLQSHDSAVWQNEDNLEKLPGDGRIPFLDSVLFQTGQSPIELLLPNFTRVILDANTTVHVEMAESEDETVLELQQGRVLVKSDRSVHVYHADGYQADLVAGIFGVEFNQAAGSWSVDCLEGMCQLGQEDQEEPVDLVNGQSAQLADDVALLPVNTQLSRIAAYNNLDASIILPTATATATPTATAPPTPTSSRTPTNTPIPGFRGPETTVLGPSVGGTNIELVRIGNGPETLLLVGGIHSGYAPNSVQLVQELVDYFEENLTAVPDNVTLYIITNLNPDAISAPGELAGRLNANGVDLNRNWDCRWEPDPIIFSDTREGAGGTAVLSEPETSLLSDFITQIEPDAVLFWGAGRRANGLVSPGACEERSLVSVELVLYYASVTGYDFVDKPEVLADPDLTGDVTNWLDKIGIPAIYVILPGFLEVDFARELEGVLSVLTAVSAPEKLQQTPTPLSCQLPVNPAWEVSYEQHRVQLGCPESGVNQPMSVWQPYEHGRILWRQDTDRVYVLFDDGTMSSFLVNDPSLRDFWVSDSIKGAIGYVYDSNTAVSQKLGQPQDQEREAADVTIQDFSNGFIIAWRETNLQTNLIFLEVNQWQTP